MGSDFELKISPTSSFSTSELELARGILSPFFWPSETNSMFILTAKLTGIARGDIRITINGSGTRIEIGWGQPVRKMEIREWMYKKETETRRFRKIFRIPDGVVLDEIKAKYNDEESILKILMPKSVDGIFGVGIEEVKDQDVGEDAFESQDSEAGRNTSKIFVPKVRSARGIELDEGTSITGNHRNEKDPNSGAHNGSPATMINKQSDIKIQSQAAVHQDAQGPGKQELSQPNGKIQAEHKIAEHGRKETYKNVWELKEFKSDNEPKDTESPLQSPAHEHEETGVDHQQGKSFQTKDEIKEAIDETKSPQREKHEQSRKQSKQERNQGSKQFKMHTPIIIAGAALLASLAIVVFNLARSKRREKKTTG